MAKKMKKDQNSCYKDNKPEGVFVPAGVLSGIGYGLLVGNVAAWTLIGLGVGFGLMAIIGLLRKKK